MIGEEHLLDFLFPGDRAPQTPLVARYYEPALHYRFPGDQPRDQPYLPGDVFPLVASPPH